MRTGQGRPGENETFEEYFSELPEAFIDGEHRSREYRIHLQERQVRSGKVKSSHFTAYIRVPEICTHDIDMNSVPPAPGHHGINFGPTDDGWIGFGTLDDRDYNYDSDMKPFPEDNRTDPEKMFSDDSISHFTPEILHDAVIDWIDAIEEWLETRRGCQVCEARP